MIWNKYPYTDFHEQNLDWVIAQVERLSHEIDTKLESMIREQLDRLFVNAMYDPETETLILILDIRE